MLGGGADKLEKQRKPGKLTARERIDALVDPDSLDEAGLFAEHRSVLFGMEDKSMPADGVVTGAASIGGRLVHLASQDFTVAGGSAGEVHSIKVAEIMMQSLKTGSPFIFINDSGGARVQEGIDSLSGYGKVFYTNVMLSGAVPQISLILRTLRGRRGVQPGADRLHHSGARRADVHHRPAGDQRRDRRECDRRGAGRRRRPYGQLGRDSLHRRERRPRRRRSARSC